MSVAMRVSIVRCFGGKVINVWIGGWGDKVVVGDLAAGFDPGMSEGFFYESLNPGYYRDMDVGSGSYE
jgi:hypothetical protein